MFETQGGTRNRTRDLPKKGSAFITSSDHWTVCCSVTDHAMPASASCGCRMFETALVGLLMASAVMAVDLSSAAVATSSATVHRQVLMKNGNEGNEGNEGDEGDEGNEGLDQFIRDRGDQGNEGDEGNEGNEGDEGDEGNEGDEGDEGNEGNEGNEGDEGDEGDEGEEGNEGNEGGNVNSSTGSTLSTITCQSQASARLFMQISNAHATAMAEVFTEFCRDDFDGRVAGAASAAFDAGFAIAAALAESQAACVSSGNTFGCASASATAEAWAMATAEAHATAVAASAEECDCLASAQALSVGSASTFIELIADAFARAEVEACVEGDTSSFAVAYATCSATAYATVWTKAIAEAILEGDCYNTAIAARIVTETSGDFGVIEGCVRDDFSFGDASGATDGSTAEGVRRCFSPHNA